MDRLTEPGMLIGTPGYLAPEAIEGLPEDTKSDVHSLGAVLCFALTASSPYGSDSFEAS